MFKTLPFIRVMVKLTCLLSNKSEYQGIEMNIDFFFFFVQNGSKALPPQVQPFSGCTTQKHLWTANYRNQLAILLHQRM